MDHSEDTIRELIATELASEWEKIGIVENGVWDADTTDSPRDDQFPLLVVRWYDVAQSMGRTRVHPFDLWIYIKGENRTPGEAIATAAAAHLTQMEGVAKLGGYLSQISDTLPGLGRGADLADEGYDALVVVHRLQAVYNGD
jgi:hypothetical protein